MRCMKPFASGLAILSIAIVLGTILPSVSWAHCDTMDGPVATEARAALEKGDVTPVLKWVGIDHEAEIKAVFQKVSAVRRSGSEAKEVADRYFLETLIRLHRAGEGEPFAGLKPAGAIEPAVDAADKAIETGSVDELAKELGHSAQKAVQERFGRLMQARKLKDASVASGREYVAGYVEYVHFVEALHDTVAARGAHHGHDK
jgi:hypothetical protein